MKLKNVFMKGLKLLVIYLVAIICMLMMAEHVERLNEQERLEKVADISMKIDK